MTGDGADELFGGYNRYIYIEKLYSFLKFFPKSARLFLANKLLKSNSSIYLLSKIINYLSFTNYKIPQMRDKLEKIYQVLSNSNSPIEIYLTLLKVNYDLNKNVTENNQNIENYFSEEIRNIINSNKFDDKSKMMIIDQNYYLPGDILHKVDRSSNSFSN